MTLSSSFGALRITKYLPKLRSCTYMVFVLTLYGAVSPVICGRIGSRGKIRADLPGVEMGDYRFKLGDPYVVFYERDNYRGAVHFQLLEKTCKNLPPSRQNWASSIDVQKRCISVCPELDCTGNCVKIIGNPEDPNNKGASRLSRYNMNDKVKSVKFCYS